MARRLFFTKLITNLSHDPNLESIISKVYIYLYYIYIKDHLTHPKKNKTKSCGSLKELTTDIQNILKTQPKTTQIKDYSA